jgi:PAS domain S-box-containing protein
MNSKTNGTGVVVGLALIATFLAVDTGLAIRNIRALHEDAQWVAHTYEVLDGIDDLRTTLEVAAFQQRSFLLTGEDRDVAAYSEATSELGSKVERLRELTVDNARHQERIPRLRELVSAEILALERDVESREGVSGPAPEGGRSFDSGPEVNALQAFLIAMEDEERHLLAERERTSEETYRAALATSLVAALLGLAAVGMFVWLLQRHLRSRSAAAAIILEQRQLLEATLSSIGDGVIVTDEGARVMFLNPVAERLSGWTHDQAEGADLLDVFHIVNEDTREAVDNPATRALREGVVVGLANHTVLVSRDGTERPIDDSAAPIRDEEGRTVGAVLVFRDVTERRRAEQDVATSHQFLRSSLDALSSHIAVIDETGVILSVNEAWRRFAEENQLRTPYYAVGTNYLDACAAESGACEGDDPDLAAHIREVIDGTRPLHVLEYPCHSPTVQRWFQMRVTRFAGQGPKRAVISHEDVTQRVQADLENKRLNAELREADHRKDEFLATLAHELRNPLAPVRNSLEIMKRADGDRELTERARVTMERQVVQMVRLVDDLLDISRITRNKLELRRERVDLAAVVQSAVETSRPLVEANAIELSVALPDSPVYLDADPTRLAQVLSNLLNNSAKYTNPSGHVSLTAETDESGVVIRVRDTGVGIPAEMLPSIFDMFTQVEQSLDRSQGGLGIGLTLVRRLVEMHGGTVEARSDGVGRGSEFSVRLPTLADALSDSSPASVSSGERAGPARRILIVDDNSDSAESLALFLEITGNAVRVAHDGLEAVEVAAEFEPAVILMDIGLPKMNGYDAARAIRAAPWGERITMIAMTGWGQDEDRRRSTSAGFDHHFVKPVDPVDLQALLDGLG